MSENLQRIGIGLGVVSAVAAVYAFLKLPVPPQVTALQPSSAGSTLAPIAPVSRVFNFGDDGTGSAPYILQNLPPIQNFKPAMKQAGVNYPDFGDASGPSVTETNGGSTPAGPNTGGGDGCCCHAPNAKFQYPDGFSYIAPSQGRLIEDIYRSPRDQNTIQKTAQQVASLPAPATNQSTGTWAPYNYPKSEPGLLTGTSANDLDVNQAY